ncbi:MAG: FHA domain-containing protein [Deltaproteobacteria bacterium]|nr:FHA domain-containing protein [Deltaproteobacteria bacterium]
MAEGLVKTLGVSLWDGQRRGAVSNAQTVYRPAMVPSGRAVNVREMFVEAYPRFADVCRSVDEPGIAILAVDERTGRPAGIAKLCARVMRPVAAIVGRHDHCDLYLNGSEALSLRQFAVVLSPVASWKPGEPQVRYRVLDLKTELGMLDEEGRPLCGLRAEGPAILRCAGYALYIMVLGDPSDWPASGADAWSMLPERVYFDELEHCAGGSMPRFRMPRDLTQSVVMRTSGPRDTGARLVGNGDVAGTLEIIGPERRTQLTVGHEALRDGILLGRYARCDGHADDPSLSRVHTLLLHDEDRLLAIDTASCNGTRAEGEERARVTEIGRDTLLRLGKHTRVTWRWSAG